MTVNTLMRQPTQRSVRLTKDELGHKLRLVGLGIGAVTIGVGFYLEVVRSWMSTWGATAAEATMPLPGDELVPNPVAQTTQAVTIHATPAAIYPWLLQLGVGRGGMYSYDWLENLFGLNIHTVDHIVPELQNVKAGDFLRFTPQGYTANGPGVYVVRLEPERALIGCFGVEHQPPPPYMGTWQFVLQPQDDGTTRLLLRTRTDARSPMAGIMGALFEPLTFVMQRKLLLTFRDFAEGAQRDKQEDKGESVNA